MLTFPLLLRLPILGRVGGEQNMCKLEEGGEEAWRLAPRGGEAERHPTNSDGKVHPDGDPPAPLELVEAEQRVLQVEAAEPRWVRLPRVAVRARRARERLAARRVAADVDGGDRELGGRVGFRLRRHGRSRPRRSGRQRRAVRREVERDRPGGGGGIARGQKIKFLRCGKGRRRTVRTC